MEFLLGLALVVVVFWWIGRKHDKEVNDPNWLNKRRPNGAGANDPYSKHRP